MPDGMQTLEVVERLFPAILLGEKKSTIRWNETVIVLGPMKYVCSGNPSLTVIVNVFRCSDMALSEVAEFLGQLDNWPNPVMLEGMREHYPEIELEDIVQVIEHSPPIDNFTRS